MSKLEEVARAIEDSWAPESEAWMETFDFRPRARAAIDALSNPSPAMVEAAAKAMVDALGKEDGENKTWEDVREEDREIARRLALVAIRAAMNAAKEGK